MGMAKTPKHGDDDGYWQEWHAALLPLHFDDKDMPDGSVDITATSGRPVLMDENADQAARQRFLNALLEISWLPPGIRREVAKAVGRPLRQRNVDYEAGRTLVCKVMVAEVEARMRAAGQRPPMGDIHTAAIEEVAETVGIGPEALKKRIQRIRHITRA
jgi:hypothetical protein